MTDLFAERRAKTDDVIGRFRASLEKHLGDDLPRVLGDHTTVYVTGSGGRGEMSDASDLDLFLVRKAGPVSRLDAVLLQAAIIRATRECKIEEPSADGVFLEMHSADEFVNLLGSQQDDPTNKFTARMLLMLESRPVLGDAAYSEIIQRMIEAYWSTGKGHEHDYMPFPFVNDVVRYWRVVLLNHESKLREKKIELQKKISDGDELERRMATERYIRSVKLRFARALTCFASLAYLLRLAVDGGNVTMDAMGQMIAMTPLERLSRSYEGRGGELSSVGGRLRAKYANFLIETAYSKDQLRTRFADTTLAGQIARQGSDFGNDLFDLLTLLGTVDGKAHRLYRHMLV